MTRVHESLLETVQLSAKEELSVFKLALEPRETSVSYTHLTLPTNREV